MPEGHFGDCRCTCLHYTAPPLLIPPPSSPDQWSDMKTYIACQIKRYSPREAESDGGGVLGEAKHFIEALVKAQEESGAGRRVRGPYLARLELLRQLKEAGLEAAVDLGESDSRACSVVADVAALV